MNPQANYSGKQSEPSPVTLLLKVGIHNW